jgi:hypothetical protein
MRTYRALVAADPRRFGRAAVCQLAAAAEQRLTVSEEVQLFTATFAAGFVFISILIG